MDFLTKTSEKMYLLETKAAKDIDNPNTAVKARAAVAWCDQASIVVPAGYNQPQTWEYLILSESFFKNNIGLGFAALVPFCRTTRDRIIAQAQDRLFI
jgi:type III restriction enzyme